MSGALGDVGAPTVDRGVAEAELDDLAERLQGALGVIQLAVEEVRCAQERDALLLRGDVGVSQGLEGRDRVGPLLAGHVDLDRQGQAAHVLRVEHLQVLEGLQGFVELTSGATDPSHLVEEALELLAVVDGVDALGDHLQDGVGVASLGDEVVEAVVGVRPRGVGVEDLSQPPFGLAIAAQVVHEHGAGLLEELGASRSVDDPGEHVAGLDHVVPGAGVPGRHAEGLPARQVARLFANRGPKHLDGVAAPCFGQRSPRRRAEGGAGLRRGVHRPREERVGAGVGVVARLERFVQSDGGGDPDGVGVVLARQLLSPEEGVGHRVGAPGDHRGAEGVEQERVARGSVGGDLGEVQEGVGPLAGLGRQPEAHQARPAIGGVAFVVLEGLDVDQGGRRIDAADRGAGAVLAPQRIRGLRCHRHQPLQGVEADPGVQASVARLVAQRESHGGLQGDALRAHRLSQRCLRSGGIALREEVMLAELEGRDPGGLGDCQLPRREGLLGFEEQRVIGPLAGEAGHGVEGGDRARVALGGLLVGVGGGLQVTARLGRGASEEERGHRAPGAGLGVGGVAEQLHHLLAATGGAEELLEERDRVAMARVPVEGRTQIGDGRFGVARARGGSGGSGEVTGGGPFFGLTLGERPVGARQERQLAGLRGDHPGQHRGPLGGGRIGQRGFEGRGSGFGVAAPALEPNPVGQVGGALLGLEVAAEERFEGGEGGVDFAVAEGLLVEVAEHGGALFGAQRRRLEGCASPGEVGQAAGGEGGGPPAGAGTLGAFASGSGGGALRLEGSDPALQRRRVGGRVLEPPGVPGRAEGRRGGEPGEGAIEGFVGRGVIDAPGGEGHLVEQGGERLGGQVALDERLGLGAHRGQIAGAAGGAEEGPAKEDVAGEELEGPAQQPRGACRVVQSILGQERRLVQAGGGGADGAALVGEALDGKGPRVVGAGALGGDGVLGHALEGADQELGVVLAATEALHRGEGAPAGRGEGEGLLEGRGGAFEVAVGVLGFGELVEQEGPQDRVAGGAGAELERGAGGLGILGAAGGALEGDRHLGALGRVGRGRLEELQCALRVLLACLGVDGLVDQRRRALGVVLRAADRRVVEAGQVVEGAPPLEEADERPQRGEVVGGQIVGRQVRLHRLGGLVQLLVTDADPPAEHRFAIAIGLCIGFLEQHLQLPLGVGELRGGLGGWMGRPGGRHVRWGSRRLRHRGVRAGCAERPGGPRTSWSGPAPYQRWGPD